MSRDILQAEDSIYTNTLEGHHIRIELYRRKLLSANTPSRVSYAAEAPLNFSRIRFEQEYQLVASGSVCICL